MLLSEPPAPAEAFFFRSGEPRDAERSFLSSLKFPPLRRLGKHPADAHVIIEVRGDQLQPVAVQIHIAGRIGQLELEEFLVLVGF